MGQASIVAWKVTSATQIEAKEHCRHQNILGSWDRTEACKTFVVPCGLSIGPHALGQTVAFARITKKLVIVALVTPANTYTTDQITSLATSSRQNGKQNKKQSKQRNERDGKRE